MCADNHMVGNFFLEDIPPLPAGKQKCTVTFRMDQGGMLTVRAKAIGVDGSEKMIRIEA